jgi:phosphate transport system substrate-binding protein
LGATTTLLLVCVLFSNARALPQRHHILGVGSSTMYPIVSATAERFGHFASRRAPVLEATGTVGGFERFCAGIGLETPDFVMASRRIKPTEREMCRKNGIDELGSILVGYDGIALVTARASALTGLSSDNLFMALNHWVPDPVGRPRLVPNPYLRWSEIDAALPEHAIRIIGPPPTSGTRDVLIDRVLATGCDDLDKADDAYTEGNCSALREDGAYENARENDSRLVRQVSDDRAALGIVGFNFLTRNRDKLKAVRIDGISPSLESINSGAYPLARPLLLYYKQAHIASVPGLDAFLQHIASPTASGVDGYLIEEGLIPGTLSEVVPAP